MEVTHKNAERRRQVKMHWCETNEVGGKEESCLYTNDAATLV